MRILVLHSDVAADAPPDERDTIETARAVSEALHGKGHQVRTSPFVVDLDALRRAVANADLVFNLVESVFGDGMLAAAAPHMLEKLDVPFTGARAACLALTGDKVLAKRLLRTSGVPTADWSEPPHWQGLVPDKPYIVKSVTEDASQGLDDGAVVTGRLVSARAAGCRERHGGRWFAEAYLDGREFNLALLDGPERPKVFPIAEMRFEHWPSQRPRIVGFRAKWDETSDEARNTVRHFGLEATEPSLAQRLTEMAFRTWDLFGLRGYARVDLRLDGKGLPMVLEANPNPCLAPDAGFAAAAGMAGLAYADLLEHIVRHAAAG